MPDNPAAQAVAQPARTGGETSLWDVDSAHSSVSFSIRHMMITSVRGEFRKVSGVVSLDERDVTRSSVEGSIEVASIDTREADRDGHLRSGDFFDARKFPEITFRSKTIARAAGGELTIAGEVTIRDVTKPISLAVEEVTPQEKDPRGKLRFGASARGRVYRKDFGLGWDAAVEGGGLLVGQQVKLVIEAEFVKRDI